MKRKKEIPADQGLQRFSSGINLKYDAPVFADLAILDDSDIDPETCVPFPSESRVIDAKEWVDENRL